MLLAFLRGLLKPYYNQGSRSVAAEHLVLEAIAVEETGRQGRDMVLMQAAFSSHFARNRVSETMGNFGKELRRLAEMSMLNVGWSSVPEAQASVDSMLQLYEALEKAGIIRDNPNVKL